MRIKMFLSLMFNLFRYIIYVHVLFIFNDRSTDCPLYFPIGQKHKQIFWHQPIAHKQAKPAPEFSLLPSFFRPAETPRAHAEKG